LCSIRRTNVTTHRESGDRDTDPSGMTVFTTAVSLFFVISILLFLGSVVLALSPLLFIFYVGVLVLTLGSAYYYARDRWY
jgi:Flp pilus assembly protein TadB